MIFFPPCPFFFFFCCDIYEKQNMFAPNSAAQILVTHMIYYISLVFAS